MEALINMVCELKNTSGSKKNCVKFLWWSDIPLKSYQRKTVLRGHEIHSSRLLKESIYTSRLLKESIYTSRLLKESIYTSTLIKESIYTSRPLKESIYTSRLIKE